MKASRRAVGRNHFIAPFLPRAAPIDGSLPSKRRNKAITPYGPQGTFNESHSDKPADSVRRQVEFKVTFRASRSVARCKGALRTKYHGQDALILGCIQSGRTRALRFGERDRLSVKRAFDAHVLHVNCKTEISHRVPIGVCADGPEVEARVAIGTREDE